MKKIIYIFSLSIVSIFTASLFAQDGHMVAGAVMDEQGETLVGVTVVPQNNPSDGVATDLDGKFRLQNIPKGTKIVFNYVGYEQKEYNVQGSKENLKIVLKEKINELNEAVVVGRSTQRKISITGAISTVEPNTLSAPGTSISNMLGGNVAGLIAVSRTGEPGKDFSEFWVRGISTFGAGKGALVLIDGIEGNINDVNVSDIESFSVLKDASATAVYGVRGANGVILINTKRGKAGELKINVKTSGTLTQSARQPKYVGANTYASLANEARAARGLEPEYDAVELDLFASGMDPDLYPDVNWRDEILKDHSFYNDFFISASGGGANARYYLSVDAQTKDAVFKQDKTANKYNTNVDYKKYGFRANIDANLTKTTVLSLDLNQVITAQSMPGYGGSDDNQYLWDSQAYLTPVTVPVKYSNGMLPAFGQNGYQISPYVLLNHTGYKERNRSTAKINAGLHQKLDFVTQGLAIHGLFSYTANSYHNIYRRKLPDLYYATGRGVDGALNVERTIERTDPSYDRTSAYDRKYYGEFKSDYEKDFGDNKITALVHYYMEDFKDSNAKSDLDAIPWRYQALSGRVTYSFQDTYFVEANVGYTGSENFQPGQQFGVFPALSGAWIPSQYDLWKKNVPFVNHLKFRASVGQVGNDRLGDRRFPYLTTIMPSDPKTNKPSYWGPEGITENRQGSDNLRWETAMKYNFGIDVQLLNDKVALMADIFKDVRSGIFQERATIPDEAGLVSLPFANVGKMKSSGIDGNARFSQKLTNDLSFTMRGNFTFSKNEVLYFEQSNYMYPYQSVKGIPHGTLRGLIALGLFKDQADVESSPKQVFEKEVLPGDIKYKDVNGDGQINDDDIVPLAYSEIPQIQYGFATEIKWKKFVVAAFFEGTSKANFFYGGNGFYPFIGKNVGNVLDIVADQNNRWTPASISGDPRTENPNARFPRLSYGPNENNNRASTFWLADASYLRLKNVELSYQFSNPWLKNIVNLESATVSLIGNNLIVWDSVKLWDPGQASKNGSVYPIQRTFSIQLNAYF